MPKSETTGEDGWWERVFNERERLSFEQGCEKGDCFTFACRCRQEAIRLITQQTGVCFADQHDR